MERERKAIIKEDFLTSQDYLLELAARRTEKRSIPFLSDMKELQVRQHWTESQLPFHIFIVYENADELQLTKYEEVCPFYLSGGPGIGKTMTAILSVDIFIEIEYAGGKNRPKAQDLGFITVYDYIQSIKDTFGKEGTEQAVFNKWSKIPYLIIDDIGVEKVTDWSYEAISRLIRARHENMVRTWFTSNITLNELGKKHGDSRLIRRIQEISIIKSI